MISKTQTDSNLNLVSASYEVSKYSIKNVRKAFLSGKYEVFKKTM